MTDWNRTYTLLVMGVNMGISIERGDDPWTIDASRRTGPLYPVICKAVAKTIEMLKLDEFEKGAKPPGIIVS